METVHPDGTPLSEYLEGEGYEDLAVPTAGAVHPESSQSSDAELASPSPFAPSTRLKSLRKHKRSSHSRGLSTASISRFHHACSSAFNSRIGRADNTRFLEHFRYIIVASQLLNEYVDRSSLLGADARLDGTTELPGLPSVSTSIFGATAIAVAAFALVYSIHLMRKDRGDVVSKSSSVILCFLLAIVIFLAYTHIRQQWLRLLRRNAVTRVTSLTSDWHSFEATTINALSLIQEVELVSRGYGLSKPLPPISRVEEVTALRRCLRLRKAVYRAYAKASPAIVDACTSLRHLAVEDDLERYLDIYDITGEAMKDATNDLPSPDPQDDAESLKSLRIIHSRAGVLRRATLCSLMALEADGGKSDFHRWRATLDVMANISRALTSATDSVRSVVSDMDSIVTPATPTHAPNGAARERLRSQARKISTLSSGVRALQAKMQILCEETNSSIEQDDDPTDLGPDLLAQYDAIGADLRDLQQAWEAGKALLQNSISQSDRRSSRTFSLGGSAARSSIASSLGGLTAVEEYGSPADALKALSGEVKSNRSSLATATSDEEGVFEAIAMPRQRNTMSREERIARMQDERERQTALRARREANTSMLRELESVINLRPKQVVRLNGQPRITSV